MAGNQLQELLPNPWSMPLTQDFYLLVIRFLREEGLHESAHSVERDSRAYFDLEYLKEKILAGELADADWYIRGYFSDVQQNSHALRLLFEINKQKYLETLLSNERQEALDILQNELMPLVSSNEDKYYTREIGFLLSLDHLESQNQLSERCGDLPKARNLLFTEIRNMVLACPDLQDKLNLPSIPLFRIHSLLSQSFEWQNHLCLTKQQNPVLTMLLDDHNCTQSGPAQVFQLPPAGPSRERVEPRTSTSEGALHSN